MADIHKVEIAPGLVFDVGVDGRVGAPLVLLLHGFSESFHMWRPQLTALAAAGTGDFVSGPYRFEVLPGVGHFAADQAPDRVNELLLAHLAKYTV